MSTKKVKEMDQLDIDAKAASDMRVSYGKYIALFKGRVAPAEQPKRKKPKDKTARPLCVICGKEIPAGAKRHKTCGAACADILRAKNCQETKKRRLQKNNEATNNA